VVLRTLEDASTVAMPRPDPSFPTLGANVTAAWSGSFTTTLRVNDDWIWARSCWSMTFASTPNAASFVTSSGSAAIPALAREVSMRPVTAYSVENRPASRVARNDGNGPVFPVSPATIPAT